MSRRNALSVAVVLIGVVLAACVPPVTSPPPGAFGASAGCGVTTRGKVTDHPETVVVGRTTRRYTITIPPNHVAGTTAPVPLVFDFHGLLEGFVGTHPLATQFSAEARAKGFAVVYPIGSGDGVYWDVSLQESNVDLRFVDTLLSKLESTMCIDRSRVYITGLSFGASMTSMLMCMRANTFAAAAPVAGIQNLCAVTPRKVPFVTFHGTADPILPFEMYADTPRAIAAKYGCDPTPVVTIVQPTPDPVTKGPITHTTWDCRQVDSAAEFYIIGGGGHSWPGSLFFSLVSLIVGRTATSINATDVIWDFFSRHHL